MAGSEPGRFLEAVIDTGTHGPELLSQDAVWPPLLARVSVVACPTIASNEHQSIVLLGAARDRGCRPRVVGQRHEFDREAYERCLTRVAAVGQPLGRAAAVRLAAGEHVTRGSTA